MSRYQVSKELRVLQSSLPTSHDLQAQFLRHCSESAEFQELAIANLGIAVLFCFKAFFANPNKNTHQGYGLLQLKQKQILESFRFPAKMKEILRKVEPSALSLENLFFLRDLYLFEELQKAFHHLERISNLQFQVVRIALEFHSLEVIDFLFLKELEAFSDSIDQRIYQSSEDFLIEFRDTIREMFPKKKIRSIANLKKLHEAMILKITKEEFQEDESIYLQPPIYGNESILPIFKRSQLFEEGRLMHNCVYSYESEIQMGITYVYRVLKPERCTVSISYSYVDGWVVEQVKGKYNRSVEKDTLESIQDWFENSERNLSREYLR